MRKAQISMEYMMVTAFAFLLTIPLLGLFYTQSANFQEDVASNQVDKVATEIINAADEVYYLGKPSKKTVRAYLPNSVKSVTINGDDLIFLIESTAGDYEIVKDAATNLTGTIKAYEGVHVITIEARNNDVRITEQ